MVILHKRLPPIIGKFTGAWSFSNWLELFDPARSPKGPLDMNIESPNPSPSPNSSPRGLKSYHLGRVGLGILVAVENLGDKPSLVPVQGSVEMELKDSEDYTVVTYHRTDKPYTRVYCNETRKGIGGIDNSRSKERGVASFSISSPKFEDVAPYPPPDFLSYCHLCKKKLLGKDIYMYWGELGFCSNECRHEHIVMDERSGK